MREFVNTAIIIALIAIAVVVLLLAPKGFQFGPPDPIVSSSAPGSPRGGTNSFVPAISTARCGVKQPDRRQPSLASLFSQTRRQT